MHSRSFASAPSIDGRGNPPDNHRIPILNVVYLFPLGCGTINCGLSRPERAPANRDFWYLRTTRERRRREGPLLARKRSSSHARGRSGLPPTTDFRAVTSAFALISSALPPGTDLLGDAAEGPNLTRSRLAAAHGVYKIRCWIKLPEVR